jgi:hypothetical protein
MNYFTHKGAFTDNFAPAQIIFVNAISRTTGEQGLDFRVTGAGIEIEKLMCKNG